MTQIATPPPTLCDLVGGISLAIMLSTNAQIPSELLWAGMCGLPAAILFGIIGGSKGLLLGLLLGGAGGAGVAFYCKSNKRLTK